jgi:hypothetical protein
MAEDYDLYVSRIQVCRLKSKHKKQGLEGEPDIQYSAINVDPNKRFSIYGFE